MKTKTIWGILVLLCLGLIAEDASAQYIWVRVSVKHMLDSNGQPPSGDWMGTNHWREAIDKANAGNARLGRGFRYLYPDFDGAVSGFSQYFDIQSGEEVPFEYAMRTNPQQSHWRTDALNVYVVRNNLGCSGWASSPWEPLSPNPPYSSMTGRIVAFCVNTGPLSVLPHEFGHHFGLIHTWVDDKVADTPIDSDPGLCPPGDCNCMFANTLAKAAAQHWSAATITLMTNNLMSYHCDINDDFDLSEGQLDRYTDTARAFLASEASGVTQFVDRSNSQTNGNNGYSTNAWRTVWAGVTAANAAGGDILMVRPGSYNEQFTINKPMTLRATRAGRTTIGKP